MEAQSQKRAIYGEPRMSVLVPALVAVLAASPELVRAQEATDVRPEDRVPAAIASSFAIPSYDLLHRKHDSTLANVLDGLTVTPTVALPFNSQSIGGRESGELTSGSPTASLSLRYQPAGHWFAQASFIGYLDPARRARWNPDFTYSFGYDDWHPYTLSFVYSVDCH